MGMFERTRFPPLDGVEFLPKIFPNYKGSLNETDIKSQLLVANIVCYGRLPVLYSLEGAGFEPRISKRNARPLFERANYKVYPSFNPIKEMMMLIFKVF
jgi:hypothetical protein